jgi:hypothetical protein
MGVGRLPWAVSARRRMGNAYHGRLPAIEVATVRGDAAQQVFVHTAGDVSQHSFPRHWALLATGLHEKIELGWVI